MLRWALLCVCAGHIVSGQTPVPVPSTGSPGTPVPTTLAGSKFANEVVGFEDVWNNLPTPFVANFSNVTFSFYANCDTTALCFPDDSVFDTQVLRTAIITSYNERAAAEIVEWDAIFKAALPHTEYEKASFDLKLFFSLIDDGMVEDRVLFDRVVESSEPSSSQTVAQYDSAV